MLTKFILRFTLFTTIFAAFIAIGVLMPPTPRSSKSLLFSRQLKDERLCSTEGENI